MARPETLVPGNCYFSVAFYDSDLVLPMIDTLVYVGQGTDQDEGRLWLFKEPESPPSPDEPDPSSEPPALIAFSDSQLHEIVDFDGLMQRLREIVVDHPLKPVAQTAEEPATGEDFHTLSTEVARFLNDTECVSVTMTIRFTDDGLSLGRRERGFEMGFFAHPRRDPHQAPKILSLFAGISSVSDRNRRRLLASTSRRVFTSSERGDLCIFQISREGSARRPLRVALQPRPRRLGLFPWHRTARRTASNWLSHS
jgi:hypothetical protein